MAFRPCVLWLLSFFLVTPSLAMAEAIVEYTFADGNALEATNTGTLGPAMNGTINGGTIIPSPLSPDGNGLLLGGANGNGIAMPDGFNFGDEFTISVLARLESYQNQQSILFDDYGAPGVILSVATDTQQLRFTVTTADDGAVTLNSPNPFPLDSWQRVQAVYDGSQAYLKLNGTVVASANATGAVQNHPSVTPNVGVESDDTAYPWNGAIDDFSISPVAIPEPASLVLIGLALVLVVTRRCHLPAQPSVSVCGKIL